MTSRSGNPLLPGALFAAAHCLSMPGYDIPFLAWGAFVPFLFLVEESPDPHTALRRSFLAAWGASIPLYYWIAWTIAVPGRIGWTAGSAAVLLVSAFVALHFGIAGWAVKRVMDRWGGGGALVLPAAVGAMELGRMHLFSGFPWLLCGYSLHGDPLLRQGASLVGATGLGVALSSVSAFAYVAFRHGATGRRRLLLLLAALAVPLLLALYGNDRLRLLAAEDAAGGGSAQGRKVAVVQGAVDQSVKWDPGFRAETLKIYGELSGIAAAGKPELIVWPETAAPFFYGWEAAETSALRSIVSAGKVPVLFGVPWMEERGGKPRFYNSILLLDDTGVEGGRYDKRHLVPFGEYIPLRFALGFLNKLTEGGEDFSTGDGPKVIRAAGLALGPSVCYEAIFPSIQRDEVGAGATVLVNVTNDSWFGDTVAPWQHLAMARMRSVETGRPMVRAANAGVSAFIGPDGSFRGTLALSRRDVLFGSVTPRTEVTPFMKWGEYPSVLCSIITVLLLMVTYKVKPCPRE